MCAYSIEQHHHQFAAWAASRAASTSRNCRFEVAKGQAILINAGFDREFATPANLPDAAQMDARHRQWRNKVIAAAAEQGLTFTHGVAAKLINVYLKSKFVLGGHHGDPRVQNLHPPLDRVLLTALAAQNFGGHGQQWHAFAAAGWSNFSSADYEGAIALVRGSLNGAPLWRIEEHWQGHQ
jgi:hypothetical protein